MKLLDNKTPQERMAFRKRSLKLAILSGVVLLLSVAAIKWGKDVERPLGGYFFLGGLLVAVFSVQGVGAGMIGAVMPPISKWLTFLILGVFLGGGLIYVNFFGEWEATP